MDKIICRIFRHQWLIPVDITQKDGKHKTVKVCQRCNLVEERKTYYI